MLLTGAAPCAATGPRGGALAGIRILGLLLVGVLIMPMRVIDGHFYLLGS